MRRFLGSAFSRTWTNQAGKTIEAEFVKLEGDMEDYMTKDKMPWPAVRYRDANRIDEITNYKGRGIPCLVLVDRQGTVIAHSHEGSNYVGPTSVMNKMGELARSAAAR